MPEPIRVFLSYSWDSEAHKQQVLNLAQRLRKDGIDAQIDSFTPFPPEGWQRWMENEIEAAKFVIVIATDKYETLFVGLAPASSSHRATREGAKFNTALY